MAEKTNDIELRSEKVRNIVGQIPPVLLRKGITIISIIILLFLATLYFIPCPETDDAGNIIFSNKSILEQLLASIQNP